ncbi:MAG: hypothetical protein WCA78_09675 [Rhizomicrobium sp.]
MRILNAAPPETVLSRANACVSPLPNGHQLSTFGRLTDSFMTSSELTDDVPGAACVETEAQANVIKPRIIRPRLTNEIFAISTPTIHQSATILEFGAASQLCPNRALYRSWAKGVK